VAARWEGGGKARKQKCFRAFSLTVIQTKIYLEKKQSLTDNIYSRRSPAARRQTSASQKFCTCPHFHGPFTKDDIQGK
jgi:hypothetical protein